MAFDDATVFLPFDDFDDDALPHDDAGGLNDLQQGAVFSLPSTAQPPVAEGAFGPARLFGGIAAGALIAARDRVSGTTLHQRDLTIQSVLTWDIALATAGNPGTIIARGIGTTAAERMAFALEIRLVDLTAQIGEVRWLWHDAAGALKTQVGAQFKARPDFMLVTATRRWITTTSVVLRYYLGDELVSEVPSADGSIGGGTTALTTVGGRYTGAAFDRFYGGRLNQIRILPREMCHEELRATVRRITVLQPAGHRLYLDSHDQGFPMPKDFGSYAQREARLEGHALGFVAGQAENILNMPPDRAYGPVLEQWEGIARTARHAGDSTEQRRARVTSRLSHRDGDSIPGNQAMLAELVDTDVANLDFLGFDQTIVDDYGAAGLNEQRWRYFPADRWSISSGHLRVQNTGAGNARFNGAYREWYTARTSIGGRGREAVIMAKLTISSSENGTDTGLALADLARGNVFLLAFRKPAAGGDFEIVTSVVEGWSVTGESVRDTTASSTVWLILEWQRGLTPPQMRIRWSTVGETGPFDELGGIHINWTEFNWAMLFHRNIDGATPSLDALFDDVKVRAPHGERSSWWWIYRDPALAGEPDMVAARGMLRELKQSHTRGGITNNLVAKYGDPDTGYGITPMGAI